MTGLYTRLLPGGSVLSGGFRASAQVRVNDALPLPSLNSHVQVRDANNFFAFSVHEDLQGGLGVSYLTGFGAGAVDFSYVDVTIPDAPASGVYNFVELISDGGNTANLLVNGTPLATVTGVNLGGVGIPQLNFGDGISAGQGIHNTDFALIDLEFGSGLETLVPEPASMAMLATGLLPALPRRKRA